MSTLDSNLDSISEPPPSDWRKYLNDEGKAYYYDRVNKVTQWKLPAMYVNWRDEELDKILKNSGWRRYKDKKGRAYYCYEETKVTQWKLPENFQHFERLLNDRISDKLSKSSRAPPASMKEQTLLRSKDFDKASDQKPDERAGHQEEKHDGLSSTMDKESLRKYLAGSDSILEHNVKEVITRLITKFQDQPSSIVDQVQDSYVGVPHMTHIVAEWISLAEHIGDMQQSSGESDATDNRRQLSSSVNNFEGDMKIDAKEIIMSRLGKLVYEQFDRNAADEMVGTSTSVPKFLTEMIADPSWRKLLIELYDMNRDSVLLRWCLRQISEKGHHREIAQIIREIDLFEILPELIVSMSSSVISATTNIQHAVEDLKRMCYHSDYSYFYAENLLLAVESNLNQKNSIDDPNTNSLETEEGNKKRTLEYPSSSLVGWKCKIRRLRQELDDAAIWRTSKHTNQSKYTKKDALETASSFALGYNPFLDPKIKADGGLHQIGEEFTKILKKNSIERLNIDRMCDLLVNSKDGTNDCSVGMAARNDNLSAASELRHPKVLALLLDALIHSSSSQSVSKIANIISSICCLGGDNLNRANADVETISTSAQSIEECRNDCLSIKGSVGSSLVISKLRKSIENPTLSSIVLSWISYSVDSNLDSLYDMLSIFLQLVQEISMKHAMKRPRCFEILTDMFCARQLQGGKAKCDILDCMIDIMVTGYTLVPMQFFSEIISDQESTTVRYLLQSIIDSIETPLSASFRTSLQDLFGIGVCKKLKFDERRTEKYLKLMNDGYNSSL